MPGAFNASRNFTQNVDGLAFGNADSLTAAASLGANESLPAAPTGVLTIRTSGTAGTLTMDSAGHGITTGARLDIYWAGGSCRGALVGTVAGTSVPFTAAVGTALPASSTAITAAVPTAVVLVAVGNNCVVIAAAGDAAFTVVFADGSNVEQLAVVKTAAGGYCWFTGDGTNPLAGLTTAKVFLSHGSAAGPQGVRAKVLYN